MTKSRDGITRATVNIAFRISEYDRTLVAFVNDYTLDGPLPKPRLASRKEIVTAILSGFTIEEFWREDVVQVFCRLNEVSSEGAN